MPHQFLKKSGFTLMELISAVIIVGVLATFAMPRMGTAIERSRAAEGLHILSTIRDAEHTRRAEQGSYTTNLGLLDVTIGTPKYFGTPSITGSADSFSASLTRTSYGYTLAISDTGTVTCSGGSPSNICARLGY